MELQKNVIEAISAASKQAGTRAQKLHVTNHHVGPYQWETRLEFRAKGGERVATATVKRKSKYLSPTQEAALLRAACEHASSLKDEKVWVYREPILEDSFWPRH